MRSFLISLGLAPAVAVALCFAAFAQDINLDIVQTQILTPTIQLNKNCSGQIISSKRDEKSGEVKTYILTAKHCTNDVQAVRSTVDMPVYDADSRVVATKSYYATVVSQFYKRDVALMVLTDKTTIFPAVAVDKADAKVKFGEPVLVAGYPAGLAQYLVEGRFGGRETLDFNFPGRGQAEYFRATAPTMGGNSGGGLYRMVDGRWTLIGVMVVGLRENPQMGFYVPIDMVREFLALADPLAFPKTAAVATTVAAPPVTTVIKAYQ
jgi:S1-C subfamily serine protease